MTLMISQIVNHTANSGAASVIVWSCVLVATLVVAFIVVGQVKKRFRDDDDKNPAAATGFTLSDLRQLHRDGELSDEEFDRAKAKIVEAARKAAKRDEPKESTGDWPQKRDGES